MNELIKLLINFVKDLPKLRPTVEEDEGLQIQENIEDLKRELEKSLSNKEDRWNFYLLFVPNDGDIFIG